MDSEQEDNQTQIHPLLPQNLPFALPELSLNPQALVDKSHTQEKLLFEQVFGEYDWFASYQAILSEGWYWRDAAYIAWFGVPKRLRIPATTAALAELLGFTVRTLNSRLAKNPAIRIRAAKVTLTQLYDHMDDVMEALVKSASDESYKSHPDRKLYFEMTGVYVPKQGLVLEDGREAKDWSVKGNDDLSRQAFMEIEEGDDE